MKFARIVLLLSALPFVGIGVAFLVAPSRMGALIGIDFADATALADARAVYGGLQIGCGGLLAIASRRPTRVAPGIAALVLLYGGLLVGRIVGLLVDGAPSPLGWLLASGETTGLVFGLVAWRGIARTTHPPSGVAGTPRAGPT